MRVQRLSRLAIGLVLYAASIAMLVRSTLGNMPWDVLGQGVARQLGWSLGTATLVISVVVLLCWLPLRQRPGSGTVANVLVIGLLVDPFMALLGLLPDALPLWGRVLLALGGVGLNAVATALYIGARLGPGPRDGLMTGLVARTGGPVGLVRFGIEAVVVAGGGCSAARSASRPWPTRWRSARWCTCSCRGSSCPTRGIRIRRRGRTGPARPSDRGRTP